MELNQKQMVSKSIAFKINIIWLLWVGHHVTTRVLKCKRGKQKTNVRVQRDMRTSLAVTGSEDRMGPDKCRARKGGKQVIH